MRNAIVGTLQQIAIALLVTVPLGLTCAVFMSEVPGKFASFTRTVVEAMTALPSIVAGLFIYATLIVIFGVEKSGFAAAMALSIMMMPIIIRAADVVLRLVPGTLREASYALGAPRWRTVLTVVLPTAKSGLTTAVILGTARGIGETSPVLLTSGYTQFMQTSPFGQPQTSLPLAAFTLVGAPESVMITRGFGAAAVLMILVLILFVLARTFGGRGPGQLTARQQRRRAAQSRRDLARYVERSFAGVPAAGHLDDTRTTEGRVTMPSGRFRVPLRLLAGAAALALVATQVIGPGADTAVAQSYVPISGAGSTWSENAVQQWIRNVKANYGMQVNFSGTGSSDGRNQFKSNTVDFAVSEIEYGLTDAGVTDTPPQKQFAYMPIVAGGTAFMYNLTVGGQRVRNLRLSGATVAKIFTGQITTWDHQEIKADNPAIALPARKIVPVVRADGSGTTAQFTRWLDSQHKSIWNAYCQRTGRNPCGFTSNYPVDPALGFIAKARSDGVAGYVKQAQLGGLDHLRRVLVRSGRQLPGGQGSQRGGLLRRTDGPERRGRVDQGAAIRPGPHSGSRRRSTTDADNRTYPLSSYSYMILPTAVAGNFSLDKGRTLGRFAYYFLCEGQQQVDRIGYSPLPINLVQAGFAQVQRIPGVDRAVDQHCGLQQPDLLHRRHQHACELPRPSRLRVTRQGATVQCDAAGAPVTGGGGGEGGGGGGGGAADPAADPATNPEAVPEARPPTPLRLRLTERSSIRTPVR